MPDDNSARPSTSQSLPAEARNSFLEDLSKVAGPLAASTQTALAYICPSGQRWIAAHPDCACSQQPVGEVACLNGSPVVQGGASGQGRQATTIPVCYRGQQAGTVVACCADSFASVADSLRHVIDLALQRIEREQDYQALHADLGTSGEKLDSFYDIISHLRAARTTKEVLDHILDKIGNLQPDLRAILWLVADGQLEPTAWKNTTPGPARDPAQGLIGKALAAPQRMVISDQTEIGTRSDTEVELTTATSLAIIPLVTRQGVLGALEVWQECSAQNGNTGGVLDARLIHLLETLGFLAGMVIENDRLQRSHLESERLQRDIEIASRIQQTLLLGQPPLDLHLIRAAAITIPSMRIDGDFYDFYAHNKSLDVIVGDVMGKGIPAALVGAATKNHFLRAMNHLMAAHPGRLPEPKEILTIVNEELIKQLEGIESFVTICYARFDLREHQLHFIDCGHTRTIHVNGQAGTYALLQGENMPLGFSRTDVYQQVSVPFGPGDVFFFYSDGITEARHPEGEQFGETRLAHFIQTRSALEPRELIEEVRAAVAAFSQAQTFVDDLTCVAVKIQDVQATAASTQAHLEISSDLKELPRVRAFLREVLVRNFKLEDIKEDLSRLELAVTEAISNIMIHAYQRQPERQIRIRTNLFVNRLLIRIYHRGQSFDPERVEKTSLDTPRENRMGLHIIRECVDQVRYFVAEHGENCVQMVKLIRPKQ